MMRGSRSPKRVTWFDWLFDANGLPGRLSAAAVALVAAVVLIAKGVYAGAFVVLIVAVAMLGSAARYKRRQRDETDP
jgi:hypothetical protein